LIALPETVSSLPVTLLNCFSGAPSALRVSFSACASRAEPVSDQRSVATGETSRRRRPVRRGRQRITLYGRPITHAVQPTLLSQMNSIERADRAGSRRNPGHHASEISQ
jgi:hypothetical protein